MANNGLGLFPGNQGYPQDGETRGQALASALLEMRNLRDSNDHLRGEAARVLDQYQRALIAGEAAMAGWREEERENAALRLEVQRLREENADLARDRGEVPVAQPVAGQDGEAGGAGTIFSLGK